MALFLQGLYATFEDKAKIKEFVVITSSYNNFSILPFQCKNYRFSVKSFFAILPRSGCESRNI